MNLSKISRGCSFCMEFDGLDYSPKEGYLFYAGYSKQIDVDEFDEDERTDLMFCPFCGRELNLHENDGN